MKDYTHLLKASANYFDIISQIIQYKEQVKILHWQTTSFAEHKAFDSTYSDLNDILDTFVEAVAGKYGRFKLDEPKAVIIKDYSNTNIVDATNSMINFLTNKLPEYFAATDTEILNIRDEILGILDKLKYLLTLK